MDVSLGEFVQNSVSPPWLTAFRLLSKLSPGLAEVGIRMSSLSEFERDYAQELLYPPTPGELADRRLQRSNPTLTMYGLHPFHLQHPHVLVPSMLFRFASLQCLH